MEGLTLIGQVPPRQLRTEFEILVDTPIYEAVKAYASIADMDEIEGWARSFYTLDGILEAINHFSKPLIQEPTDQLWHEAKRDTLAHIRGLFRPVNSLTFETGFDTVPFESDSAAGYGYFGKKGEGDNFHRAKGIASRAVRQFSETIESAGYAAAVEDIVQNSTPDIAFTRTQLAKLPSIKVRNVFGEAFHYIIIEGLSAAPLLEAFKRQDTFYFTGKDPTIYVPRLLLSMSKQGQWYVALDWSKFDASVQLWEIDHAFNCIEQLLTFPTPLTRRAFEYAKETFRKRKLASPDGRLLMRTGGIPSGSYYTNLIGSVINFTRIDYICKRLGLNKTSCYVQGDDSIMMIDGANRPDLLALMNLANDFGWQLNIPKCMVTMDSTAVTFLGRSQRHQLNTRERLKVLRLMCFPEYKVEDPQISTSRARAIATDAGFNDPLYNKIVYRLKALYGEAAFVPAKFVRFVDKLDFHDVNM